jgi:hypothetical protein
MPGDPTQGGCALSPRVGGEEREWEKGEDEERKGERRALDFGLLHAYNHPGEDFLGTPGPEEYIEALVEEDKPPSDDVPVTEAHAPEDTVIIHRGARPGPTGYIAAFLQSLVYKEHILASFERLEEYDARDVPGTCSAKTSRRAAGPHTKRCRTSSGRAIRLRPTANLSSCACDLRSCACCGSSPVSHHIVPTPARMRAALPTLFALASASKFTGPNMNGEYKLAATPNQTGWPSWLTNTSFRDYPGGVEMFEVHLGPVTSTYGEVFWTHLPSVERCPTDPHRLILLPCGPVEEERPDV